MSDLPQLPGPTGDIRLPGAFGLATDGYTADQMREYATASLASVQQRIAELERALGELVALEDLKKQTEALHFAGAFGTGGENWHAQYTANRKDYIRRLPLAWAAARALVPACQTCGGKGVLARHASDGSWDDQPCPACARDQVRSTETEGLGPKGDEPGRREPTRPSKRFLKGESPQATWPFAQDDKVTK